MSNLRTDYKDDVYTGNRKYHMSSNGDGTVSFTDETQYIQNGDRYGAEQINEVNGIINNLDNNVYKSTDAAITDIADNDYIPIYDTSASARKKTLWSNIKNLFTQTFAIKVHSSNSAGTYGAGTDTHFGHVKLSDSYTSEFPQSASQSVGASEQAVTNVYSALQTETTNRSRETSFISANLNNHLTANNKSIYMDYQNGKYGINTSANRSADTFIPFNRGFSITYTHPGIPDDCVPTFLGYSNGVLQLGTRLSGDQYSISGALEEYVVTNCKHIVFDYQEVHGDGRGSLYIDEVLVASNTSYSGDLDPNVTHTIQVRAMDYHHQFARGYTFTFDM